MVNNPIKFLGRELDQPTADLLALHSKELCSLAEIASDYLKSDWEKQTGAEELLTPILFLRNQIELIEGIAALVKQSLIHPCYPLLRSLIETLSIYSIY